MGTRRKWQRPVREPPLDFVPIGAGLFGAYGLVSAPDPVADRNRIVVIAGDVERLGSFWDKRRMRPPTAEPK